MLRYIIVSLVTGLLFGMMDGLINGNPFAVKLMECYKPIARLQINIPAGIIIDLLYGFAITGIFFIIMPALPGNSGFIKGLSYGLLMWFFRVLMGVITSWMMHTVPLKTLLYILVTGLIEMLILGIFNGLLIKR